MIGKLIALFVSGFNVYFGSRCLLNAIGLLQTSTDARGTNWVVAAASIAEVRGVSSPSP